MENSLASFEAITRKAFLFSDSRKEIEGDLHPFEERNVYPKLPDKVRVLFDDGHFPEATFEAYKFVDKTIQKLASSSESGFKLMMTVLKEDSPLISLNSGASLTDKDEQKGYQFLFAGSMMAIRNPRGHEHSMVDSVDTCLDHLTLASLLLRRLERGGYTVAP
jgi:uncharacterized protein (TIGR02391 family)